LAGILPGLETSTSDVSVTFFYSFGSLIFIMSLGWAMHKHKFFTIAYPYGTPKAMIPFIISIEIISYIARAISLGMRLFANMFAGHALVKILLAFSMQFLGSVTAYSAILSFAVVIVITLMEIGIAFLQAYVFGALVTLYFIDMARMEH
jgi:ATP synthase subunit 6